MQRPGNGHRRAGEEAQKVVEHRKESRDCVVEVGDGPDHCAAVPGSGTVAQRTEEGAPVADREDPFGEVWGAVQQQIQESPGLEAKTLFEWLQREYQDGSATGRSAPCNGGSISEVDPIVWTKNRRSLDGGAG